MAFRGRGADPSGPSAYAHVGGWSCTGLRDVTRDAAALDSAGFWVVVAPFDAAPYCLRFGDVARSVGPIGTGGPWHGPDPGAWTSSLDEAAFCSAVLEIRDLIAAGQVYQVNLTRRLSAPLPEPPTADVVALASVLGLGNPAPFSAVIDAPLLGLRIASASPERFIRRDGDVVRSSPIKGTAARRDGFLPKDTAENVMIVDLVRNDLGRVCEWGSISVPSLLEVEPHPGLHHLVSTVQGRLRSDAGWSDLLDATFPPGSVTGAPKLAALRTIHRLEPVGRGPYCGSIGWVDADRRLGELNVAIRTFWIDDDHLHFGTGGGITYDSDPGGEWAETELKAARLVALASAPTGAAPAPHTAAPVSDRAGRR